MAPVVYGKLLNHRVVRGACRAVPAARQTPPANDKAVPCTHGCTARADRYLALAITAALRNFLRNLRGQIPVHPPVSDHCSRPRDLTPLLS